MLFKYLRFVFWLAKSCLLRWQCFKILRRNRVLSPRHNLSTGVCPGGLCWQTLGTATEDELFFSLIYVMWRETADPTVCVTISFAPSEFSFISTRYPRHWYKVTPRSRVGLKKSCTILSFRLFETASRVCWEIHEFVLDVVVRPFGHASDAVQKQITASVAQTRIANVLTVEADNGHVSSSIIQTPYGRLLLTQWPSVKPRHSPAWYGDCSLVSARLKARISGSWIPVKETCERPEILKIHQKLG